MYKESNALITVNGVIGTPTTGDYDVFGFDAVAGTTYAFNVQTLGEGLYSIREGNNFIVDSNDVEVTGFDGVGYNGGIALFTALTTDKFYFVVGQAGAYLTQFTISMSVFETPAQLIDAALASVKTYVDTKDAAIKAHAEALVNQLMQTTDLSAKIALLNQINDILDGDSATAGFQLWESNVSKLNQLVADMTATQQQLSLVSNQHYQAIQNTNTALNNAVNDLNGSIWIVDTRLTTESKRIKDANVATFQALKAKAAIIFAV